MASPIAAQVAGREFPYQLSEADPQLRRGFKDSMAGGAAAWAGAWRRSHGMGEAVAPLLRRMLATEPNPQRRMLLSATFALSRREAAPELTTRLILGRVGAKTNERVMGAIVLALGPVQQEGGAALRRRLGQAREPIERLSLLLALSRCQPADGEPVLVPGKLRDVGVLAALAYCQPPAEAAALTRRLPKLDRNRHRHLVWRAWLLGGDREGVDPRPRRKFALEVLGQSVHLARQEAAALLGRSSGGVIVEDHLLATLPFDELLLLAADPELRRRIFARRPRAHLPPPRVGRQDRLRWLVLFARAAPLPLLTAAAEDWQRDQLYRQEEGRRALCLALAWRALLWSGERKQLRAWLARCTGWPETAWLRAALGEKVQTGAAAKTSGDPAELLALQAYRQGRMPATRAAARMEAQLWRMGLHPGRARLDLHRRLLGALVLDSASRAGVRFAPSTQEAYRAAGVDRGDPMFVLAHEFFKFITREEPWGPAAHRLR